MKKYIALLLGILLMSVLTGCGVQQETAEVYEEINYEHIDFQPVSSDDTLFNHFVVLNEKEVAILRNNPDGSNHFVRYYDGKIVYERQLSEPYDALYYDKETNSFFAYNVFQKRLEKLNADFETEQYLIEDFPLFEIKHMAVKDGVLYMLYVEENPYEKEQPAEMDEETEYIDFGEKVCALTLESGERKELPIKNAICQYLSEEGNLYYYTCEDDVYELKQYDPLQNKLLNVKTMDDVGYIYSFIIAEDNFIYSGIQYDDICIKNLTTGMITNQALKVHIVRGMDLQHYKGNLIYMNRYAEGEIKCLYLGKDAAIASDKTELVHRGESLVIGITSTPDRVPIELQKVKADTGISATVYEEAMFEDELLLKLMAGDSDTDIYIFWTTYSIGNNIRRNGIYVPLNDSEIITEELGKYWDYVEDFAYAENGDIWAVPLMIDTMATWYVPENTTELGLTYDNLEMFDDFIDSLKVVNQQDEFVYYGTASDIDFYTAELSYNVNYSDREYNNELYKNIFEKLWGGGWVWKSSAEAENPLFNNIMLASGDADELALDTEKVAFKTEQISWQLAQEEPFAGFRVYPGPKAVSPEDKNPFYAVYAVVNPYSEKIDAATEYLEFVMQHNRQYVKNIWNDKSTCLLYSDIKEYEELYDTDAPGFQDLYGILQNGAVWEASIPVSFREYITDYQTGRYTLDEVAEYLERQAEMALDE